MNRFFVEPALFSSGPLLKLEGELAHQLGRVLRLGPGTRIIVLDGQGQEYLVELVDFQRQGKSEAVTAKVISQNPASREPRLRLTLYQSILKGEKFDYVLQKGTEIGVAAFVPLISERCVAQGVRPERWRKIIQEAAEQSGRGLLPTLAEVPLKLSEALQHIANQGAPGLMAWEEEHTRHLRGLDPATAALALLIGPEGGFTPGEAALARQAGVQTVSLGPRILRAETAGPVAAALALYQCGDI